MRLQSAFTYACSIKRTPYIQALETDVCVCSNWKADELTKLKQYTHIQAREASSNQSAQQIFTVIKFKFLGG